MLNMESQLRPPQPPIVSGLEKFNITLDNNGLPIIGRYFSTIIVFDNGKKGPFSGEVLGYRKVGSQIFVIVKNAQNPKGIEFPVPNEAVERARGTRTRTTVYL